MEMPYSLCIDVFEEMGELFECEFAAVQVEVEYLYWNGLAEKVIDDIVWILAIGKR